MIQVWVVVGESGSGKSTTIRCLTGIGKKSIACIQKTDGHYFHIFSFMRSIQEAKLGNPESFLSPIKFCDLLENDFFLGGARKQPSLFMSHQHSVANYLIPLRIKPANKLPGFVDYIAEMLKRKFVIKSLIILGEWDGGADYAGFDAAAIDDTELLSGNERAARIRKHWGWA